MAGGTGNDTYYLDNAADIVIENAGEGADHIFTSFNSSFRLWEYSKQVENLTLTDDAYRAIGNGLNNVINGNDGKNNFLNGAWGNDTIYGGSGNDTIRDSHGADLMVGGAGNDVYFLDNINDRIIENSGEGWDRVFLSYDADFKLWQHSKHVEVVYLRDDADWVTGNGLSNTLVGNATKDSYLNGAWGNDVLIGGAGNDTLADDHGNDRFTGGAGADSFVFKGSFGTDVITDFNVNEVGETIDFSAVSAITDYADLTANHLSEVGGNAVISDGLGNSVTLTGVAVADLTADDFLF